MHTILAALHPLTAAFRMLQETIYHAGPGLLGKYTMLCAWLICGLCLCVAGYEVTRRKRLDGLLWLVVAGLLFAGFWEESEFALSMSRSLAIGALAVGATLLAKNLVDAISGWREPEQRYP